MAWTDDFFSNNTATTEIYTSVHTLSLHDALPISQHARPQLRDHGPLLAQVQPAQPAVRDGAQQRQHGGLLELLLRAPGQVGEQPASANSCATWSGASEPRSSAAKASPQPCRARLRSSPSAPSRVKMAFAIRAAVCASARRPVPRSIMLRSRVASA